MSQFIALDLGAESGRVVIGRLTANRLQLEDVYRFPNGGVRLLGSLHWDALRLFSEIKNGLAKVRHEYGRDFVSVGVDTWGIDYALLDGDGALAGNPYCYRDGRTAGMMAAAFAAVPRQEIYERSGGIQFMEINTLYQLYGMAVRRSPQLASAATLLMMPDLFHYWLTGRKAVEYTNATTTQFYDSRAKVWSVELLDKLGIPNHILPEVIAAGTELGPLAADVAEDTGFAALQVVAPATHDTASAVVAVPAADDDFLWLSSGTWSLLGAVSDHAIVTPEALSYNISSYGGAGGTVLPWKNIAGLWLVQECRRVWARDDRSYSYDDLTQLAAAAQPFVAVIDPDDHSFFAPPDMPAAIQAFCHRTGQIVPQTHGEIVRTALEGLALRYKWVADRLERLWGRRFTVLHIVGGGSQNRLLCQFAADALQRPVVAGPVEATAIGNIALQAVATGAFGSLAEARDVIRQSFDVIGYEPGPAGGWDAAYERFLQFGGGGEQ